MPAHQESPLNGRREHRVLFHPFRPKWLVVNPTAHDMAAAFLRGEPAGQVAEGVAKQYEIPLEKAQANVLFLEARLTEEGFFEPEGIRRSERRPSPRSLFLHLTDRCNLSCPHCYTHKPERPTQDLSTDAVLRLLDELRAAGGSGITLSGGEPLLHPDIKKIMAHARPDLEIRLLTNGTLMDREWAQFLADHGARVQVSIDGSCPAIHDSIRGKGSFNKALRAVGLLKEAGLSEQINIAATVMRQNLEDLPAIVRLAERLDVHLVRFLPLRNRGTAVRNWEEIGATLTREDAERFYDLVIHSPKVSNSRPEVSCGLSGFMLAMPEETDDDIWGPVGHQLVVDVDGSAYPCAAMMTPEFLLGSVFTETVADLFSSPPMQSVCQALTERRQKIEKCAACTWRNLCQSGCMALALEHKGTIWETDDFCEYRKKLYREAFDRILALQEDG